MTNRVTLGTLAITMVGMIALGGFAPQPAQASDTGRAIAAIAAGALVYGLLEPDRPSCHQRTGYYYEQPRYRDHRGQRGYDYQSRRRAFWNGNSAPWGHYQPQPRRNYRQQYWQGYRQGYNTGYRQGRGSCHTGWGGGPGTWGYW